MTAVFAILTYSENAPLIRCVSVIELSSFFQKVSQAIALAIALPPAITPEQPVKIKHIKIRIMDNVLLFVKDSVLIFLNSIKLPFT
ncbi:hypothetical protein FACS1894132_07900 [Clostridia bacterium]|nr:hypothetical protein FACS1894132_07900 [Clostridia bacterium]